MNTFEVLTQKISKLNSFLCIGLDPDEDLLKRLNLTTNDVFLLNKLIIDATSAYCVAYKPQFAHYGALGLEKELEQTCAYIKDKYPEHLLILDAKRGDIGNTAKKYAQEAFERYRADAVTVNPYMGKETLLPFLAYENKAVIVLLKTSNAQSGYIQNLVLENELKLYEYLALDLSRSFPAEQLWFVVGGTDAKAIKNIRTLCPEQLFLVPGVGAQGGDIETIIKNGARKEGYGLLINISRGMTHIHENMSLMKYQTLIANRAKHNSEEIRKYALSG